MQLLEVKNLNIYFGEKKLVDNVNFSVSKGEVLAIVGQSGSGKSLSAMSVAGLTKHIPGFRVEGEIIHSNKNLLDFSDADLRKVRGSEISYIFQDPMTSLNPLHKLGKQLFEAMNLHQNITKTQAIEKIHKIFDLIGLSNIKGRLDAYPYELSGGQRQRIMIAMALINDSPLIIADEPTTALDVTVQSEILALFKKLKQQINQSMIFISHDLTVVKEIADKIVVMNQGKVIEVGDKARIFDNPQNAYTKKLLNSLPDFEPVKIAKQDQEASTVLEAKNLVVKYVSEKSLFGFNNKFFTAANNINFSLSKGHTLGIVGESGSGKSTIAKAILKLVESSGEVLLSGENIIDLSENKFKKYREEIQIVFQDPYSSLNPRMTVFDLVSEGLLAHRSELSQDELWKKVENVLEKLNLSVDVMDRYPNELSGGEKQRVGIARAIILEPKIIVFDEPTSALDLITQAEILKILKRLQKEMQLSYIFISHDLRVIRSISHQIAVMKDGKIVEFGTSDEVFENPKQDYTKTLIKSAFLR